MKTTDVCMIRVLSLASQIVLIPSDCSTCPLACPMLASGTYLMASLCGFCASSHMLMDRVVLFRRLLDCAAPFSRRAILGQDLIIICVSVFSGRRSCMVLPGVFHHEAGFAMCLSPVAYMDSLFIWFVCSTLTSRLDIIDNASSVCFLEMTWRLRVLCWHWHACLHAVLPGPAVLWHASLCGLCSWASRPRLPVGSCFTIRPACACCLLHCIAAATSLMITCLTLTLVPLLHCLPAGVGLAQVRYAPGPSHAGA